MNPIKIAELFDRDHGERTATLERARECARLTIPGILPDISQNPNNKLAENYQSVGARGIVGLAGQMLLALYPSDRPWVKQELAPEILYDEAVPVAAKQAAQRALFLQDLTIMATIESSGRRANSGQPSGFRTAKRAALEQLLVTGDVLERIDDDFRITVFRRDKYVTRRTGTGEVMYHIVLEEIDPLSLTDDQLTTAGFDLAKLAAMPAGERVANLYTMVEWMPREKKWKTTQSVCMKDGPTMADAVIHTQTDRVSHFISTPFKLSPGEHYGRGLVETNLGDLGALDQLCLRAIEFAEVCSRYQIFLDEASDINEKQLAEDPSGAVRRGRVSDGKLMDVAVLKIDKLGDFEVARIVMESLRKDIAAAFLVQPEMVRDSERTTKFEVASVTIKELNNVLGGVYAPIADHQQLPMYERIQYQLVKTHAIKALPKGTTKVSVLTGIAALANQAKFSSIVSFAQLVQSITPNAANRINDGVLLNVAARYLGVMEPGLIYDDDQMKEKINQQLALQAQSQAIEQGVKTAGAVTEQRLAAQAA